MEHISNKTNKLPRSGYRLNLTGLRNLSGFTRTIANRKYTILFVVGAAIAAVVYFSYNPATSRFFPPCLFHKFTGWQCPGCGTQRAVHSLLHLDIVEAFGYNPILIPALLLVALLVYLEHFGGKKRFPALHRKTSGTKFTLIVFFVIIAYWIGRNLV